MPIILAKFPLNFKKKKHGLKTKKPRKSASPRAAFLKAFMKQLSTVDGASVISAYAKGDNAAMMKAAMKLFSKIS